MRARLSILLLLSLALGCTKTSNTSASSSGDAVAAVDTAASALTPDSKAAARATWDAMNAASNAFEPSAYDHYAPKAVLKVKRHAANGNVTERGFAVSMFLPLVDQLMESAKLLNDQATYENVTMEPDGERWKISASRYSTVKCATDPDYYALLGKADDGRWLIDEEFATVMAVSNCAPNPDEARRVLGELKAQLDPQLPLTLDDETRLDTVVVDDLTLVTTATLTNTSSTYGEMDEFLAEMRKVAMKQGCGLPSSKYVLHHGGTVRYVYMTNDDKVALDMALTSKECQ